MKTHNLNETNNYVKSHGAVLPNGQIFLTKPLKVFKKVYEKGTGSHAIANLIIPVGAIVNLAQTNDCKLRTNLALVWNIVKLYGPAEEISTAVSGRNGGDFTYKAIKTDTRVISAGYKSDPGKMLNMVLYSAHKWDPVPNSSFLTQKDFHRPKNGFDLSKEECSSGIHFFIDLDRARNW